MSIDEVMRLLEDAVNHRNFNTCRKYANLAYRMGSGVNVEPPIDPESLFRKVNTQLILPWQEMRYRRKQLAAMHTLDDLVRNPRPLDTIGSEAKSIRNGLIHGLIEREDLGLLRSYFSAYARATGNELLVTVSDHDMIRISLGLLGRDFDRWCQLEDDPVGTKRYLCSEIPRIIPVGIWVEKEKRDIQFRLDHSGKHAVSTKPVIRLKDSFSSISPEKLTIKKIDGRWVWNMCLPPSKYSWSMWAKKEPIISVIIASTDEYLSMRIIELKGKYLVPLGSVFNDISGWTDNAIEAPEGFYFSKHVMCYLPSTEHAPFRLIPIHCYKDIHGDWRTQKPVNSELIPTVHPYGISEGDFVRINHDYDASCDGVFLVSKLIIRARIPQAVLVKMRASIHEKLTPVTKIVPSFMLEKIRVTKGDING